MDGDDAVRGSGEDLADLQIGSRLRHARVRKGMRMRQLAEKVGCTESMVSKLESGHVAPSLVMLQRLVAALDLHLSSFFGLDPTAPGVILKDGTRSVTLTDPIRQGTGVHYERLVPFGAGSLLEGNVHVVQPGGEKTDLVTHQGETLGYVLEGVLELTIDATTYLVAAGDSFFFRNHLTNRYRNPGEVATRIVWVNTPQVH